MSCGRKWIDVSVGIDPELAVWPGGTHVEYIRVNEMQKGAASNDTAININLHTGTHIDAPRHFIADGHTIDLLDIEVLLGEVYVAEIYGTDAISEKDLIDAGIPEGVKRLFVKTENSMIWKTSPNIFHHNFIAFDLDAAMWIVKKGIKLIGIDYLSIQKYKGDVKVHQIILGNNIIALEGVDLSKVKKGYYEMICLPLRLKGVEASPVRVLLQKK